MAADAALGLAIDGLIRIKDGLELLKVLETANRVLPTINREVIYTVEENETLPALRNAFFVDIFKNIKSIL